jgi:hypothetical protein
MDAKRWLVSHYESVSANPSTGLLQTSGTHRRGSGPPSPTVVLSARLKQCHDRLRRPPARGLLPDAVRLQSPLGERMLSSVERLHHDPPLLIGFLR